MRVKVAQLYEDGGHRLPTHRAVTARAANFGCLALAEHFSDIVGRTVARATLRSDDGMLIVPPIQDAVVRSIDFDCMNIVGYELDEATGQWGVQSWHVSMPVQAVLVTQLYEDGKPVLRGRLRSSWPSYTGKLRLTEQHDPTFRRTLTQALLHGDAADFVLPVLYDAVVRFIDDQRMTISGFETDAISRRCVAQSWYVRYCA